jgi:hypothetical protein
MTVPRAMGRPRVILEVSGPPPLAAPPSHARAALNPPHVLVDSRDAFRHFPEGGLR